MFLGFLLHVGGHKRGKFGGIDYEGCLSMVATHTIHSCRYGGVDGNLS